MTAGGMAASAEGMAGLGYGEHLLVWTLRKFVVRRGMVCPVIRREFRQACGDQADGVLTVFRAFLDTIGLTARRRVSIGHPGWCGLTGDERQILGMIGAAQADDQDRLAAQACWFARGDRQPRLMAATRALAAAFAAHELLVFSAPPPNTAARPGRPPLRLVS